MAKVTFFLNPKQESYVNELVRSGLFGDTSADVVETLMNRQIVQLIIDGFIKRDLS